MPMSEEEYIKNRIDNQIDWYGRKSAINKKYYLWSNAMIIIFAALIPFIANFEDPGMVQIKHIIAAFGVFTAIFTGISALYKFQEKWTTYRITAETIKREKLLFQTRTAPYNAGASSFNLFVSNAEALMNNEQTGWMQIVNQKKDDSGMSGDMSA